MKKVLAIALMLLIPCTAFAMETMSVDEMAEIAGQSGVAIALDDVKVFFYTENEETWYQSEGSFTAANKQVYNYRGAIGLIRWDYGQMMYLNAVLATDPFQGAAGNFTSIGSGANTGMGTSTEPNMKRPLMGPDYMALNSTYGFNFGNVSVYSPSIAGGSGNYYTDMGFDSKALTIRAVNRAEVFSLGAFYRLNALVELGEFLIGEGVALGNNHATIANDYWAAGGGTYAYGTTTAGQVAVAAVTIGLPTVEVHYRRAGGEVLEVQLGIAANPLNNVGFTDNQQTSDTWSYGKIYYGDSNSGDNVSTRTILVLDGFIEITPMEQYANPKVH